MGRKKKKTETEKVVTIVQEGKRAGSVGQPARVKDGMTVVANYSTATKEPAADRTTRTCRCSVALSGRTEEEGRARMGMGMGMSKQRCCQQVEVGVSWDGMGCILTCPGECRRWFCCPVQTGSVALASAVDLLFDYLLTCVWPREAPLTTAVEV
jgi:hypothetical protein